MTAATPPVKFADATAIRGEREMLMLAVTKEAFNVTLELVRLSRAELHAELARKLP